ncbi:SufD family Fe-S cluster assembly protein [Candidatus Saccharibacteria bacterium]|jgi:Fe-S cluster assembly scaffold protein SufB|nr:SufD family Fe-S cluster assembly protein [Candidatus Saccharibacteria bacterium]
MSDYSKVLDTPDQQETFADVLIVNEGVVDYDTVMTFAAARAQGDITVKAVVAGDGELNLTGNLIIEKSGINARGFLKQDILLLSESARAKATPQLEIKTDEVRASHSATVGQVDQEQLFYLQARGLSSKEAKATIVRAFLADTIDMLNPEQQKIKAKELNKLLASQ